jgi:sugar phosphate isomerase/epimerase
MYECLNQSCFPGLSTAEFAEVVARAGATSQDDPVRVELRTVGRAESAATISAAIRTAGLRVESVCGLMDWALADDPDPRPALEELLEVAVAVQAPVIVCVAPIRANDLPPHDRIVQSAIDRLTELSALADTAHVKLALEQVGRSTTRPGARSGIRRLREALLIAEAAGEDAVLAVDSYNLATAPDDPAQPAEPVLGEPFAEVASLPPSRIGIAQIADWHVTDDIRVLPGEGRLDLPSFIQALHRAEYEGPLSLEIFPAEPWEDPMGFARRAKRGLRNLLGERGHQTQ